MVGLHMFLGGLVSFWVVWVVFGWFGWIRILETTMISYFNNLKLVIGYCADNGCHEPWPRVSLGVSMTMTQYFVQLILSY